MLEIVIPEAQFWDEKKEEFVYIKGTKLVLEHSLVSISKWESKWKKPFLQEGNKTYEETIDYIRCMMITQNVDPNIFRCLTMENIDTIQKYIDSELTATWFSEDTKRNGKKKRSNGKQITSELIYYWMIAAGVPMECQKWHLSRLMTLIRVCSEENKEPEKMSKRDIYKQNAALNAARKKRLHTKG